MRAIVCVGFVFALAACGADGPGQDAPYSGDVNDVTPFARADAGPVDDEVTGGVALTAVGWPGACQRLVTEVGADEPLYTFTTDDALAPAEVVVTRTDARGNTARYRFFDVDTRASCLRPVEELGQPYLEIVGCPAAMDTDVDGNGMQSPSDRDYAYAWGTRDELLESAAYDAMDGVFLDARWQWMWTQDGRLRAGERALSAGTAGSVVVEPLEGGYGLTIDVNGDGRADERRTYAFDGDGRVVRSDRSTADPATGELLLRATSEWRYDCPAP